MPAQRNTRVAVPLSEEGYDAISLISQMTGVSRGRILAEALEAAVPAFITIAQAYQMTLNVEASEKATILDAMGRAEAHLVEALRQAGVELGDVEGRPVVGGGEAEPDGARERSDPPVLTGGFPNDGSGGSDAL